jgi:hypothetical protein
MLPLGLAAFIAGVWFDIAPLRWLGRAVLLLMALMLAGAFLGAIGAGFVIPVQFIRTWRQRSTSERCILTPLVAVLAMMMLLLVFALAALVVVNTKHP